MKKILSTQEGPLVGDRNSLGEFHKFYETLSKKLELSPKIQQFCLDGAHLSKINLLQREMLKAPNNEEEVKKTIDNLKHIKVPGQMDFWEFSIKHSVLSLP